MPQGRWSAETIRTPDALAQSRMARDQRPGRLCLGHHRRRRHAALSRLARSPRCRRRSGRMMMFNHSSKRNLPARRPDGAARRRATACNERRQRQRGRHCSRVSPGRRSADLALRMRRLRAREDACCMPYRSNTVHLNYRLLSTARPSMASAAAGSALSPARGRGECAGCDALQPIRCPWRSRSKSSRRRHSAARLQLRGPRRRSVLDGGRFHDVEYAARSAIAATTIAAALWRPAIFAPILTPRHASDACPPRPSRGKRFLAIEPADAWNAELERRQRLDRSSRAARSRRHWRGTGAGRRPVHHHADDPREPTPLAPTPPATRSAR